MYACGSGKSEIIIIVVNNSVIKKIKDWDTSSN